MSAKGGLILLSRNGYHPNSPRMACSFNSVEPQMNEAPNAPNKADAQSFERKSEASTHRIPTPSAYGHHRYPKYRSPRITQINPKPMMNKVAMPTENPNQFTSFVPSSSPTPRLNKVRRAGCEPASP